MTAQTLTVYGDSILKGIILENGRYISRSSWLSVLEERLPLTIRNLSRFGSTVEKGYRTMERDLAQVGCPGRLVLLEFGGNDCDFDWAKVSAEPDAEHLPHTTADRFVQTYRNMIARLRRAGSLPILASLPPVSSERYLSWICRNGLSRGNILRWLGSADVIYRFQESYSRITVELAESENIPLVDLRGPFLSPHDADRYLCDDGIHPNAKGQALIRDSLADTLGSLL